MNVLLSMAVCCVPNMIFFFKNAKRAATVRIPCGRASRGQAQAAAPLQRNSAKFVMKSTARHQSIGTGDKPIHSVERAALRPGIALIKGKLSCFFREKKNQRRLKRTCIDFTLISLYVKTFEGDQVVCFFS